MWKQTIQEILTALIFCAIMGAAIILFGSHP